MKLKFSHYCLDGQARLLSQNLVEVNVKLLLKLFKMSVAKPLPNHRIFKTMQGFVFFCTVTQVPIKEFRVIATHTNAKKKC